MCCQSYFCLLDVADCNTRHIFHHRVWYHVLALCCVCIRSSGIILTPRLPLCKISFLSQPPLLRKLAHSINQSLSYSPSLFDAPGTKAFTVKQTKTSQFSCLDTHHQHDSHILEQNMIHVLTFCYIFQLKSIIQFK